MLILMERIEKDGEWKGVVGTGYKLHLHTSVCDLQR